VTNEAGGSHGWISNASSKKGTKAAAERISALLPPAVEIESIEAQLLPLLPRNRKSTRILKLRESLRDTQGKDERRNCYLGTAYLSGVHEALAACFCSVPNVPTTVFLFRRLIFQKGKKHAFSPGRAVDG
jgi:hypothetical protein